DLGPQQPPRIEHNPNCLAAFDFKDARNELVPARCGRPADVARIVALAVFAKAFEFPSLAALAATALLHLHLPAPYQIESLLAGFLQIRKHAHRLRDFGAGPPFREAEFGLIAEKQSPQADVAPLP